MADEMVIEEEEPGRGNRWQDDDGRRDRGRGASVLRWIGIGAAAVVVLAGLLLLAIDTGPGRRFLVQQIDGYTTATGLQVNIGSIDGSIYGRSTINDLRLSDPQGVFLTIPEARLDWAPFALAANQVDIVELVVPQATLARLPELLPSEDPDAPLLPNIDIDIDRLEIGRLDILPAVTGQRHAISLVGVVDIADGRAEVEADAEALTGPDLVGGDRLSLVLDARPDDDRLKIDLDVSAPADGLVASYTNVAEPLTITAKGSGSWSQWQGQFAARSGEKTLADLQIAADDGTFRFVGPVDASVVLGESIWSRLLGPTANVDLTAALSERRAEVNLALASSALRLRGGGLLDLGESRWEGVELEYEILDPSVLNDNLTADGLRGTLQLNGSLTEPDIAYTARAPRLSVSQTSFIDFGAEGIVRFDQGAILVPVAAQAARIDGLADLLAPLGDQLRMQGTFRIAAGYARAPQIDLRSRSMAGKARISIDLEDGSYNGHFTGKAPDFTWESFGLFDVRVDMDIKSVPGGNFALTGPLRAVSKRLDNTILARLSGGNATVTGNLIAPGNGIYGLGNMVIKGPQIDATGIARLLPSGQLDVRIEGDSAAYGPFTAKISGTADAPVIDVNAARPVFGIPFENVVVNVRGTPEGYLITATGDSQFGPATADVLYRTDGGIEVRRIELAGITLKGSLSQTPGGFYSGTLRATGKGLNGTIQMSERNGAQFADIDLNGRDIALPGDKPLGVGRLNVDMTALIGNDVPIINGNAQIADLKYGTFRLAKARADFGYSGGRGTAKLLAEGRAPAEYELAVNARFTSTSIVAALQGELSRQPFSSVKPLRIRIEDGVYTLQPATLRTRGGDLRLAGKFGDGMTFQSRWQDFDLEVLNAFLPSAGMSGKTTGSFDWSQGEGTSAFPEADLRLKLDDFRRSGTVSVSNAIDGEFIGAIDADGGRFSGLLKDRGRQVGRVQFRLEPLPPPAGTWSERLLEAPLTGGIRYNGPASSLFSFAGLAGQSLEGQIAIAADVRGRVATPTLRGQVRADALKYENETYGTRIEQIRFDGRFTSDSFVLDDFQGRAGSGNVSAKGSVSLNAEKEYPLDVSITFDNAQLARGDDLSARVSGQLNLLNRPGSDPRITGDLSLPEVRYKLVRSGDEEILDLAGVRRRPTSLQPASEAVSSAPTNPGLWRLDIDVSADNRIYVSGMGLESEWSGNFNIGGTASAYRVGGEVELVRGTFSFSGQRFELTRGLIEFLKEDKINPLIDIRAESEIQDLTVNIDINGRAFNPRISFSSSPARPEETVLAYILFGGPPSQLGALEAVQLAASLNSLRGSGGGLNPLGELRQATGVDRLRILGADQATGRGTSLAVGSYIGDDVYLEVITDAEGFTVTQIEIALTKAFSLLSSISTFGGQSAGVRYSKDY